MALIHVRPARAGLLVRDPVTRLLLPPEGAAVADSSYWRRRVRDGDVELTAPPAVPTSTTRRRPSRRDADDAATRSDDR
jgi:Protein of unknown function (DUF2635)